MMASNPSEQFGIEDPGPDFAARLTPLMRLQLQAIKTTDLERRLAELEKQTVEAHSSPDLVGKETEPKIKLAEAQKASGFDRSMGSKEPLGIWHDTWLNSPQE